MDPARPPWHCLAGVCRRQPKVRLDGAASPGAPEQGCGARCATGTHSVPSPLSPSNLPRCSVKRSMPGTRPGEADGTGANLSLPFHLLFPRSGFTLRQIKSPSACWTEPSGSPRDTPCPAQRFQTLQWAGDPVQKHGEAPGLSGSCHAAWLPRSGEGKGPHGKTGDWSAPGRRVTRAEGRASGAGDKAESGAGCRDAPRKSKGALKFGPDTGVIAGSLSCYLYFEMKNE